MRTSVPPAGTASTPPLPEPSVPQVSWPFRGWAVRRVERWVARSASEEWSKTRVAGSRSPVAATSRLRSSTPVSESKPHSRKFRPGSSESARRWPRTTADSARTNSPSNAFRSSGAARFQRRRSPAPAVRLCAPARPAGAGSSPRSSGRTAAGSALRSTTGSSLTGATRGSFSLTAASNRISPSSTVRGRMPERAVRSRSAPPSAAVIPEVSSHMPQARETTGAPAARHRAASASSAALAAT